VSDGLLADLGHIAEASGVGIDLSTDALSGFRDALAGPATEVGADPWDWVLGGGEDHALVATFPDAPPPGWTVIGATTAGEGAVTVDGAAWQGNPGWQSFD